MNLASTAIAQLQEDLGTLAAKATPTDMPDTGASRAPDMCS